MAAAPISTYSSPAASKALSTRRISSRSTSLGYDAYSVFASGVPVSAAFVVCQARLAHFTRADLPPAAFQARYHQPATVPCVN